MRPAFPDRFFPARNLTRRIPQVFARLRAPAVPVWMVPTSMRAVLVTMVLFSVLMRLPFFFVTTDGYMRDAAITFHDEGIFLEQGREVLRGHLPYLSHWDNATPLQWYIYGLVMLLSGGGLTGFRIFGALYVGVTGYAVFRCMADRHKPKCAWWAGLFYIIFASTLQVSQSFTLEHILALPLAVLLYHVLNAPPYPSQRHKRVVLWMFGICCWLTGSFLCMLPAVVVLYPALYVAPVRGVQGWRGKIAAVEPYAVRCAILLAVAAAGYAVFLFIYLLHGQIGYYWASVLQAPNLISGSGMRPLLFVRKYFTKLINSDQWLMALFIAFFLVKAGLLLLQRQAKFEPFVWRILLFAVCAMGMIYARGNHNSLFLFYLLQVLPIFALIMGYAINFNLADLRWFALVVALIGLHNTTQVVQKQYGHLIGYARGDNAQQAAFYGDRLYRTRDVMATFPLEGEYLIVCGEDDMLYEITGMENPRFFFFPFFHYNAPLQKTIGHIATGLRALVNDKKPLYIVGREADPLTARGFIDIGDILQQRYVQVSNIDGTIIYLRRDKLQKIFMADPK